MLTFRDLQLEVLRWIDEGGDTDTTLTLVKEALNRSHRKLLGSRTWPFLTGREAPLTTVAGTRTYALPHGVSKILTLYDSARNQPFPLISRREWETMGVDRVNQQEFPQGAIYGDVWPVSAQPAAEVVRIVSSSAGDTTQTVAFSGVDATGQYADETLTANGTTLVTGTTSWAYITGVTKVGTWAGTLTVSTPSATILTLRAVDKAKQHPTLEFIETPSSARTYLYTVNRTPSILTNDNDVPDTPYPYSEIHVYDALLDMSTYNTELGAKEQRLWQARYDALWAGLVQSVDEGIAGSRPRYVRNMDARVLNRTSFGA